MQVKFDAGELEANKYLGEGEHECAISKIEQKPSKKGQQMIEVEFKSRSGKTTRDWFMLEGNKFKLATLAMATGVPRETLLAGGFTTESLAGKFVKVVREITGKDTEGRNQYENTFLASANTPSMTNDEIPF